MQLPPAPRQGSGRSGKPPLAPGRAGQTLREATLLSQEGQAAASRSPAWESALHTAPLAAAGLASTTRPTVNAATAAPEAATGSRAVSEAEQPAATAAASTPGSETASPVMSPSSEAAAGAAPTQAAPQAGFGGQVRGQGAALLAGRAGVTLRAGQRQHAASQAAAAAGIDVTAAAAAAAGSHHEATRAAAPSSIDVAAQHEARGAAGATGTDRSDAAAAAAAGSSRPENTAAAGPSSPDGVTPAEGMLAEEGGHAAPISPLPSAFAKAAGGGESSQGQARLSGQKRRLKAHRESLPAQQQPSQQDAEPEGLQDKPAAAGDAARTAVCQCPGRLWCQGLRAACQLQRSAAEPLMWLQPHP